MIESMTMLVVDWPENKKMWVFAETVRNLFEVELVSAIDWSVTINLPVTRRTPLHSSCLS